MLSGGLAEKSSAEDQTKRISDQFTGTRCENKLLQGLHDTQMKMKEPTTPIYTFWICSETNVGALCVCVWCECATSIPLKVSTNKIVVKNCFILAAGNGGKERAWRKNSAEKIRGVCVVTSYSKPSFALLHQNCQWKVHRNVTFKKPLLKKES